MRRIQRWGIVGAIARHCHYLAALLQQVHQACLVGRASTRHDFNFTGALHGILVAEAGKFLACDERVAGIIGIPDVHLAPHFSCCHGSVASHDFHLNAGFTTFPDGTGHIAAHGVADAHHAHEGQSLGLKPVVRNGIHLAIVQFLIGKAQRAHRLRLILEQVFRYFLKGDATGYAAAMAHDDF